MKKLLKMTTSRTFSLWFYGFFVLFFGFFTIADFNNNQVGLGIFDAIMTILDVVLFTMWLTKSKFVASSLEIKITKKENI